MRFWNAPSPLHSSPTQPPKHLDWTFSPFRHHTAHLKTDMKFIGLTVLAVLGSSAGVSAQVVVTESVATGACVLASTGFHSLGKLREYLTSIKKPS